MYRRIVFIVILCFLFLIDAVQQNRSIIATVIALLCAPEKGDIMRTESKFSKPATARQINALLCLFLVSWIYAQEICIARTQDCRPPFGGRKNMELHVVIHRISRNTSAVVNRWEDFKTYNLKENLLYFRNNLLEMKQEFYVLPATHTIAKLFKEIDNNRTGRSLMNFEWARYETFKTFPMESPAMPTRLAANGFFYTNNEDTVMCFSCNIKYGGWKSGDIPSEIHKRLSPNCAFLAKTDHTNIPIHDFQELTIQGATGGVGFDKDSYSSGDIHIQQHSKQSESSKTTTAKIIPHKYPDYETIDKRRDTFLGWQSGGIIEAEALVLAGFYYAGNYENDQDLPNNLKSNTLYRNLFDFGFGDCVRCFSCGGGLRNWEYGDAPWEEHARWFPFCRYLNEHKSPEYISRFRETHADSDVDSDKNETAVASDKKDSYTTQQVSCPVMKVQQKQQLQKHVDKKCKVPGLSNIEEENAKFKSRLVCKICLDLDANVVFVPCGHMMSCEGCASRLRKCAVCRKLIKGRISAFMS